MSLLDDLFNEARAEGFAQGKAEGRIIGRFEFDARCKAEARIKSALELIKNSTNTIEEIANLCDLKVDEVQGLADVYK